MKPRGRKDPRVAKRTGNENAMEMMDTIMRQTYYCDVSRWRRFGIEPQPLFSISRA